MNDQDKIKLANMVLAPWIQKASALRDEERKVGGNQFRHSMATMAILLDYEIVDNIMLKAALIHDLIEDKRKETNIDELSALDGDGKRVVNLVLEVTREEGEEKDHFLSRISHKGSEAAKILKAADRISNLTDLHKGVFNSDRIREDIKETAQFIIPMLEGIQGNIDSAFSKIAGYMLIEIRDLLERRRALLKFSSGIKGFSQSLFESAFGLLKTDKNHESKPARKNRKKRG